MKCLVSFAVIAAASVAPAYAAGAYNCKGDKGLDVPMQFAASVLGTARVKVSAYGGSDRSGYVVPSVWRLYDASGRQVDYFPKSVLAFVSPSMLRETNLDGLVPGTSYIVELTSRDSCNKQGTVRQSLTMPAPSPEGNLPDLSAPSTAMIGLQAGQFKQVTFSLTDDSGTQSVSTYINGAKVSEYTYANGISFRWWCDEYPFDSSQSVLEGPVYYINIPDAFRGMYAHVEVVAVDVYGNESHQGAWLGL